MLRHRDEVNDPVHHPAEPAMAPALPHLDEAIALKSSVHLSSGEDSHSYRAGTNGSSTLTSMTLASTNFGFSRSSPTSMSPSADS